MKRWHVVHRMAAITYLNKSNQEADAGKSQSSTSKRLPAWMHPELKVLGEVGRSMHKQQKGKYNNLLALGWLVILKQYSMIYRLLAAVGL
jgi:hypothetical protein